jgi:hypothetical protein
MPRHDQPLLTAQTILWLQTTSGNRAVQRLLARKALERQQKMLQPSRLQQLEIVPRWPLSLVHRHRSWWRWLIQWLRRRWAS